MKVEKTSKSEEINQTEEKLSDLPVTPEQAEDAKGGTINFGHIEYSYKPQRPEGTIE
jgi:hypothetical protein